jgi:hypothetical protein
MTSLTARVTLMALLHVLMNCVQFSMQQAAKDCQSMPSKINEPKRQS